MKNNKKKHIKFQEFENSLFTRNIPTNESFFFIFAMYPTQKPKQLLKTIIWLLFFFFFFCDIYIHTGRQKVHKCYNMRREEQQKKNGMLNSTWKVVKNLLVSIIQIRKIKTKKKLPHRAAFLSKLINEKNKTFTDFVPFSLYK